MVLAIFVRINLDELIILEIAVYIFDEMAVRKYVSAVPSIPYASNT
jgi:hypothetical protein